MSYRLLKPAEFFFVFSMETIHVVGIAILFLIALPEMDSLTGIIVLHAVAIIPSILKILKMLSHDEKGKKDAKEKKRKGKNAILGVFSLIIQVASIGVITSIETSWSDEKTHQSLVVWSLPLGLFLSSFGWWECYLTENENGCTHWMWKIKKMMSDGKGKEQVLNRLSRLALALFV